MGTLVVALLGTPRSSDAGLLEIIWEMSGPQMIGLSYACMYGMTSRSLEQCRIGKLITKDFIAGKGMGPYLVLGGGIFGSTGKNSSTQNYHWGEIWMAALEPGVAVRSYETSTVQIHHAAGISYEWFFGDDIRRFDKFAFTVTPIDVAYKRVAVGVKLRMYPNGFTDDEFKPGPRISGSRPFETTLGFTFSLIVGPH
jgi:hypothetical protein